MVAVRTSVRTQRAAMNVAVNKALHSCQTTGHALVRDMMNLLFKVKAIVTNTLLKKKINGKRSYFSEVNISKISEWGNCRKKCFEGNWFLIISESARFDSDFNNKILCFFQ